MKLQEKIEYVKDLKRDLTDYEKTLNEDIETLLRIVKDISVDRQRVDEQKKRIEQEELEIKNLEYYE